MLIVSIRNANPTCVYLMLTKIKLINISCYVRKFTDFTLHHFLFSESILRKRHSRNYQL